MLCRHATPFTNALITVKINHLEMQRFGVPDKMYLYNGIALNVKNELHIS
jgi:hypothetical protein